MLHVIDGLALGGAERMAVDLANATVADGHRVSMCVTRSNVTLASELDQRIELVVLDRARTIDIVPTLRLVAWLRRNQVDVVHAHMRPSAAFMIALRATGGLRAPIVFHDHYGKIEQDASIPMWFRIGHRLLGHYVGVYDRLSAWAQRAGMPAAKTTTIPNRIPLDRFRAAAPRDLRRELAIAPELAIGVQVATLRPDKGIEVLIDAIARLRHRDRVRIVVVGTEGDRAYAAACRERLREHHLESVITLLGPCNDVPAILAASDIGLLTSHTESGPLVLIEYAAAGLPIVATRVGDIGRQLEASGVPQFVAPGDPDAFAAALDTVLELSVEARHARGELGRRVLAADWDLRSTMPRWYEVYRSALGRA